MSARSRSGCAGCLQQHKKCDEGRPRCGRCARLSIECEYNRSLRWFNGTRLPRAPRQRGQRSQRRPASRRSPPSASQPATEPNDLDQILEYATPSTPYEAAPSAIPSPATSKTSAESDGSNVDAAVLPHLDSPQTLPDQLFFSEYPDDSTISSILNEITSMAEWNTPLLNTGQVLDLDGDIDGENQHISTQQEEAAWIGEQASWAIGPLFNDDLCSMLFQDDGRHIAYAYFVRSVALILPAFGGVRNGYQQIAMLSLSSPVLLDTIVSVATTYMYMRSIVPKSVALKRQSQALTSLRKSVEALTNDGGVAGAGSGDLACLKRDLLAAILLQITIEIANGTDVIHSHIASAASLFRELGYESARPSSAIGLVLVQRMAFIDVLASIFWHRRPLLSPSFWYFNESEYVPDSTTPTFQETTGCPFAIIAILARVSHLNADAAEGLSDDEVMLKAHDLEFDLASFSRRQSADGSTLPELNADSKYFDAVGQCYYWSANILLHRRIFHDSRASARTQFPLKQLIGLLESLPIGCGPDSQLSLPLYAAALAATRPDHRQLIKAKNLNLSKQYPMESRISLTASFDLMWAASDAALEAAPSGQGSCSRAVMAPDLMKERSLFIC